VRHVVTKLRTFPTDFAAFSHLMTTSRRLINRYFSGALAYGSLTIEVKNQDL
jgi:hypothetical protein